MDWKTVAEQVLAVVLGVLGSSIALFLTLLVKRVAAKRGIELSQAQLDTVTNAIRQGVYAAERWAEKAAEKPSGSAKYDYCLKVVKGLLENESVKAWTDEQLTHLIESFIQQDYKYVNEKTKTPKA